MSLPENPISRNEHYLNRIATGEGELPERPISRIEQYLNRIATGGGEIPDEPISRNEHYLAYIAEHGGGGDITTEPLSVNENGTYRAPSGKAYTPVTVNVPQEEPVLDALSVTENGTYTPETGTDGFSEVVVNVPNPSTGALNITANGTYDVTDKASAIVNVSGGGGGGSIPKHGVFFIDYDGSIVTAWDSSEVASKATLPDNPTHDRLIAQGWNWTLEQIQSYVADYPSADVWVGQMYKTASGLTEFDIAVTPITGLTVTCNMVGNKDWGDGTTDNATSHTYADYGDYTITCDGTDIPSGSNSNGGVFSSSSSNVNRYWCTAIYVGENVLRIGSYAFYYCCSFAGITIPEGVTIIGTYAFRNCYSLSNITIPKGVTSIGAYAFQDCYSITNVTIPSSVTSIDSYAFQDCYSITNVTIPSSVTSIGSYAFAKCYSITNITIPVGRINDSTFSTCYSLANITFTKGATSIAANGFSKCYSAIEYDFSAATSVPSLSNANAFDYINGICKILVPATLYNQWITATNWSTYANYIYAV